MKRLFLSCAALLAGFVAVGWSGGAPEFPAGKTGADLLREGVALFERGMPREALPYFEEAARRTPNYAEAYLQAALCRTALGEYGNARRDLVFARSFAADAAVRERIAAAETAVAAAVERDRLRAEEAEKERLRRENEDRAARERTAADAKVRETLERLGLAGTADGRGFAVSAVRPESLAARAGLRPGDVISLAAGSVPADPAAAAAVLSAFETEPAVVPLVVAADSGLRDAAWPPADDTLVPASVRREQSYYHAAGTRKLKERNLKEALDDFNRVLRASVFNPLRQDVYLDVVRLYRTVLADESDAERARLERKDAAEDVPATIEEVRKVLDQLSGRYERARRAVSSAVEALRLSALEGLRPGSRSAQTDPAAERDRERTTLEFLWKEYAASVEPRLSKLRAAADALDYGRWLSVGARGWWEGDKTRSGLVGRRTFSLVGDGDDLFGVVREVYKVLEREVYRPAVTVSLGNSSATATFRGPVEVQFRDANGRIRDEATVTVVVSPGESREVALKGARTFEAGEILDRRVVRRGRRPSEYDLILKAWTAEVFVADRTAGTHPLTAD